MRTDVEDTVRTIYSLDILPVGDEITIRIQGNGFLYNMVRIIVGTLVRVGRGVLYPGAGTGDSGSKEPQSRRGDSSAAGAVSCRNRV